MAEPFAFSRSVSQRRTYLTCGQKYLLQYGQGWKSTKDKGIFAAGNDYQTVVNALLKGEVDSPGAVALMRELWAKRKVQQPSLYFADNARVKFEHLETRLPLLIKVVTEEFAIMLRLGEHGWLDRTMYYTFGPGCEGNGRPDFYGEGLDMWRFLPEPLRSDPAWQQYLAGWQPGILDFKTSGQKYNDLDAELDDQLTEYQAGKSLDPKVSGSPAPKWLALHVAIYTTVPTRQWLVVPARDADEIANHIHTAVAIDAQIKSQVFPRNVNACFAGYECEMVPICYPSQRGRIDAELARTGKQNSQPLTTDLL